MLFKGLWQTSWPGSASFLTSPVPPTSPSGIISLLLAEQLSSAQRGEVVAVWPAVLSWYFLNTAEGFGPRSYSWFLQQYFRYRQSGIFNQSQYSLRHPHLSASFHRPTKGPDIFTWSHLMHLPYQLLQERISSVFTVAQACLNEGTYLLTESVPQQENGKLRCQLALRCIFAYANYPESSSVLRW